MRRGLVLALTAALLCAVPILGQFDAKDWQWRATLAPPERAGVVALPLDGTLYDALMNPPHDLRVVDAGGGLIPHAVRCGRTSPVTETVARPVRVLNRTFAEGHSRAVLDFGAAVLKNKLQILVSGENYLRKVTVEVGDDQTSWETLGRNLLLFDIKTPEESHREDTLAVSENNFRYIRLTVESSMNEAEPVVIQGVNAFYEEPAGNPQLEGVPIVSRNIVQDEKAKTTTLTLDLGFRNLPLQEVSLKIGNAAFQRSYRIAGRNTRTHKIYRSAEEAWRADEIETPWSLVAQGTLHRLNEGKAIESTGAPIPQAAFRYLQITIDNGDDAPLDILDVTLLRRTCSLIFESRPGALYTLYGGNSAAGSPDYDYSKTLMAMDIDGIPKLAVGTIEMLRHAAPTIPWSEQHPNVMTAILVGVVLAMLWMIIPALRSVRAKSGDQQ
jgi:hypothetical protein